MITKVMLFRFVDKIDGESIYETTGYHTITVLEDKTALVVLDKEEKYIVLYKDADGKYSKKYEVENIKIEFKAHITPFAVVLRVNIVFKIN